MTFAYIRFLIRHPILNRIKHISSNPIARSSSIVLFFKIGTVGFNYVFFLLLSRAFGASEVGYFALSFTVIQLLSILARSGLEIGMFKEISYSKNTIQGLRSLQLKSILYISISSILLLSLTYLARPFLIANWFASETMGSYVLFFLGALPFYTLMFFNGEIHRAKKRYALFAIFQNFGMYFLLSIFMLIQLFLEVKSFDVLAWYFIGSVALLSILSFWGTFKHKEIANSKENKEFKEIYLSSIPIGISTICFFLMSYFDGLVLSQFYPESDVGTYAIAFKIALLGSFILISINSALGPRITELSAKEDNETLFRELRKTTKMGFWATMPFVLITLLFPKFILGIFGSEFEVAVIPLFILVIGQIVNTFFGPTGIVLQLTGHQKVFKNIILASTIINIILNYLLIPKYGLIGAAIVNSVSILIWKIWSTIIVKRTFGKTFFYLPFISK